MKNPKSFTFNDDLIRVPSARQLVYSDSRANPMGRLPDDTWVLRPQDLPAGFTADCDTWYFSRVCGTFKERVGWHGCQMPERLLGRIIEACSNAGEVVLDPFSGSGTTLAVAKKLGRRYLGFEISPDYAKRTRHASAPLRRVKTLSERATLSLAESDLPWREDGSNYPSHMLRSAGLISRKGLSRHFGPRHGFSVDRVIADPDINKRFLEMCTRLGLPGALFPGTTP